MTSPGGIWLLDTNIVSALMRDPAGVAAARLKGLLNTDPLARVGLSVVVHCEIQYGLLKAQSARLDDAFSRVLEALLVFPLIDSVAGQYAQIRLALEQQGKPIGPNDMLIAAHARALDAVLVTDNDREFQRVPRLRVENWLR